MKRPDREAYVRRYEDRLRQHGYAPATLGWGKHGRQEIRFGVLAEEILTDPECSVLDVGCGFGDLDDFMRRRGWAGAYRGIDLVPGLVDVAKSRNPDIDVRVADLDDFAASNERFDYVVASGIFNAKLDSEPNPAYIERSLRQMFALCRVAVCVDFMSTFVDFQHETAWHTDPAWAIAAARAISPRFRLRHDYMPFEFALTIYSDASITPRNVFTLHDSNPSGEPRDIVG